ncbi:MAG TPA: hypothetical protein VF352_05425, partial [Anaerolineales bacterium]
QKLGIQPQIGTRLDRRWHGFKVVGFYSLDLMRLDMRDLHHFLDGQVFDFTRLFELLSDGFCYKG